MKKLCFIVLLLLVGCSSKVENLEQQVSDLETENSNLQSKITLLESELEAANNKNERLSDAVDESRIAVDDLSNNVDRLQYENWRDVTPDIASSTDDANSAIQNASDIASGDFNTY